MYPRFLAFQDSSIGDLVTESVSQSVSQRLLIDRETERQRDRDSDLDLDLERFSD